MENNNFFARPRTAQRAIDAIDRHILDITRRKSKTATHMGLFGSTQTAYLDDERARKQLIEAIRDGKRH